MSRARIFWAKVLVSSAFGVLAVITLATATTVASMALVGRQPLVGLSGQTIGAHTALRLVAESWACTLPPVLGFTCLAVLLSVWSRNPAVGVGAPVLIGLAMQLVGSVGGIETVRTALLTTPFDSWHGLLTAPRFTGPLETGLLVSAGWVVATLGAAFLIFRRRDITGG